MSFFSGSRQGNLPGPITTNPTNGLCEKAVIQVKKVFDACMKQVHLTDEQIAVTTFTPANPTFPLTFVSCSSTGDITLSDVVVDRFDDKPCFARVSCDANIPITIHYVDANGVAGVGTGTLEIPNDVVLYTPQPSIVPFQIEAFGAAVCSEGEHLSSNVFIVDLCVTLIIKVVVEADILVPTYGYAYIPPCQEFSQEKCNAVFELPLFPAQQPVRCNN